MNDIPTLFLLFVLYSFLGWACESAYCSIPAGRFVNRGFLTGPFCPIYGAGALLIAAALAPLKGRIFLLFVASAMLTSLLEYMTGLLLETLFHVKYWDYSGYRFNLQGRVCLRNSLMFGAGGVAVVYFLEPALLTVIGWIPGAVVPFLFWGLAFYFLSDTVLTVFEVTSLHTRLSELQLVLDEIKEKAHTARVETIEVLQETIASRLDEGTKARLSLLYEKKEALESGFHLLQRRILSAFPTMRSVRNNESLQRLRELLQNIRRG